jgi:hypothetical protein
VRLASRKWLELAASIWNKITLMCSMHELVTTMILLLPKSLFL